MSGFKRNLTLSFAWILRTFAGWLPRPGRIGRRRRNHLEVEILETRTVPSALPSYAVFPANGPGINGYTPDQIRAAYGINGIFFNGTAGDGTGQTIAIVDAYNDPTIVSDLDNFDQGVAPVTGGSTLYQLYGAASTFFTVYNQNGQVINPSNTRVRTDPMGPGTNNWEGEEALDVEWAHAIAPGAKIDLIECNNDNDMYPQGVDTAADLPGVSVVSMSFSTPEYNGENLDDADFTTPSGHQGVTFLAATGDYGSPSGYPAYSPNVIAVGGTSLYLNNDNSYQSETAWSLGSDSFDTSLGTGGGISQYEAEPAYQMAVQSTGFRTNPDVSFDADPDTGAEVYDSYNYPSDPWQEYGGTSLATPSWAGLIAIANQGRVLAGGTTFNSNGNPTQALTAMYTLPGSDFHDITVGNNGGFNAGPGYDEVTGLGTPVANLLVPDLASYGITTKLVLTQPEFVTAGTTFSVTVLGEDNLGDVNSGFDGSVTLTMVSNPGGSTLRGTMTESAVNGVATFANLTLDVSGVGYILQFQTVLSATVTLTSTTSPFAVSPPNGTDYTQQISTPVSSTDSAGDALSYAVQVGDYTPLFIVEQQLDLQAPPGASNYYENARGGAEKYLVSGNGSNAAAAGYYIIVPNGNIYAWLNTTLANCLAAAPVAQAGTVAYADPTQIFNADPPYNPTAYNTEQTLDLQAPAANYFFNARFYQEKYLVSGNNSNPGGAGYYIIMPNGNLYAWTDNSVAGSLATTPVTLPTYYYQNPAYLSAAVPPGAATGVSASVSGGNLVVHDNGYLGSATIYVEASTATTTTFEFFIVTFMDTAPTLAIEPSTPTVPFNQQAVATLTGSASNGATLTYSAQVAGYNPLATVEQEFDLQAPPGAANYFYNTRGGQEEYLVSGNGSNPAGGEYYFIVPNGNLYAWDGNSLATSENTAAASPGVAAYDDPTQLFDAVPAYNPAVYAVEQAYALQAPPGAGNYFFNSRGAQEKYLVSTNGGNAVNGGYYVFLPNGNLYLWFGNSLSATLNSAPVATLPVSYYQYPATLTDATPPGAIGTVTTGFSGTGDSTLTVKDTGYAGTVQIFVTDSDGLLSTTQSCLITFTDSTPSVTQPGPQTAPHTQNVQVTLSATDSASDAVTYPSVQVGGYNSLFALEEQYDFQAPPGTSNYFFDTRLAGEEYLVSGNGGNSAGGGYYLLLPTGKIYAWDGNSVATSETTPVIASVGAEVYANPTLLIDSAPYNATAYATEQTLDLQAPSANYFFNNRGSDEKYLVSGNGSNPAGGGYYILMPNGNLYAWAGALSASLANAPVASLPTAYYENPSLLTAPTPPGAIAGVTASLSGTTLTIADTDDFVGTVTIYVTVSDGVLTNSFSFLVTFT